MANKQDILTAIKNLDVFLNIPDLKGAEVRLNPNGRPFAIAGGFNMVFQLTHNSKKWAFRVWHVSMGETKERYQAISKYLAEKKLSYFADFIFEEKGILVNGELLDTVRMEWLEGVLLKEYLEQNLNDKIALQVLASRFLEMFHELHAHQISHGDLQEGNILIEPTGNIKLIDYDSVCVPAIEGEKELVTGLKGYQHPSRFKQSRASLKADYFSELVIYLSILSISEKPSLWGKYQVKDSCYLLFSETDFENLETSAVYNDLKGLSTKIDRLLALLANFIKTKDYTNLSTFTSYLLPPKINEFLADKEVILQGGEVVIAWETENTLEVRISNVQGSFTSSGHYLLKPKGSEEYCLTAVGFFESQEQKIEIRVFPTPIINSIQIPVPEFTHITNFDTHLPQFPKIELSIHAIDSSIRIDNPQQTQSISFNVNSPVAIQLDSGFKSHVANAGYLSSLLGKVKNKNKSIYQQFFKKNSDEIR